MSSTHLRTTARGGQFLTSDAAVDGVFIRDDLTDEQRLFGQTAAQFMRQEVLPVSDRLYAHDWDLTRRLIVKAGELDLLRLEIPEEYGGLDLDLISASYVGEQIAVNPSFGGSLGGHTSIGTLPIVYFGTAEQKARYLPRLARGELIGAYALTEAESGSDALAARMTATLTPDGRHYVLNGQKMWITNGGFADLFTLFAKVDGEKFTAFLVERGMGVVSGRDESKLGLDGSSTTALMLDQVKVPVENLLGAIGQGHKVAFNILNLGRVKLGARNMAGVRQALNDSVAYAKARRQFGKSIAEFGLVREKLAGMAILGFVGDAMAYRTLGEVEQAIDQGNRRDPAHVLKVIETFAAECSINKVWTSEALAWAVDEAIQVHGGNGYSREFPVERAYRDARITRIYEGTNEINRLLIPARLLKQFPGAFTADAARRLGEPVTTVAGPFSTEYSRLERVKRLAIALLGHATAAFGDGLKDEQEVLGRIADIAIEAYAIESALARASRLSSRGDRRAPIADDIARVYAAEAVARVVHAASEAAWALPPGDADQVRAAVAMLAALQGVDAIALRRQIAVAVIDAGASVF